jgi:hypothetical protein
MLECPTPNAGKFRWAEWVSSLLTMQRYRLINSYSSILLKLGVLSQILVISLRDVCHQMPLHYPFGV